MHLFKNKTKDVKQFLEEMKANKTNRSSNKSHLEKSAQKGASRPQSNHEENSLQNTKKSMNQNSRGSLMTTSNISSNRTIDGSNHPNSRGNMMNSYSPHHQANAFSGHKASQEMGFYTKNGQTPMRNEIPQYRPNNIEFESEPDYQIQSNFKPNIFSIPQQKYQDLSRSRAQQNPYNHNHNYYSQSERNFDYFQDSRINHEFQDSYSQRSNSTVYGSAQFNQNSGSNSFNQRVPHNYIPQNQNLKYQNLSQNNGLNYNKFSRSNVQNDLLMNDFQNSPFDARFDNQKMFLSQVTNLDIPMEQIWQAGLSTQKDSPAKLTQFFSKRKIQNSFQIIESEQKTLFPESNILEVVQSQNSQEKPQLESQEKTQNKELSKKFTAKTLTQNVSSIFTPNSKDVIFDTEKIFHDQAIQHSPESMKSKGKPIKITSNQKSILAQSFKTYNKTDIKLDQVFRNVDILMKNIQRSAAQFNKKIEKGGILNKFLQSRFNEEHITRMEIEQPVEKSKNKIIQTEKKPKPKTAVNKKFNFDETIKKKDHYQEIEI